MNDNDTTTAAGQRAENLAAAFLERHGLRIVARNYRCRGGEIDLICADGRVLVFVEVRQRRSCHFGGAAASITPLKQQRIVRAARHYLLSQGKTDADCRIDCVLLDGERLTWLRDAVSAVPD